MQILPLPETIALFIVILGILVLAHEFGHFATAKRFGVEAPEFGIGFPPRLVTLWRTGGWIQIQGKKIRIPKDMHLPRELKTGDHVRYSTRMERGREVLAGLETVDPAQASASLASPVQSLDRGTIYTINAVPLGGFVRLNGENDPTAPNALAAKPAWQRTIILIAGVTMNLILALIAFFVLEAAFPQAISGVSTQVIGFSDKSPALQAGLRAGDVILSVDGVDVKDNYGALLSVTQRNCGREMKVGVNRVNPKGGAQDLQLLIAPQQMANSQCGMGAYLRGQVGERIAGVAPGSLASQIGLRPGDGLVRVGDFELMAANTGPVLRMHDVKDLAAYVKSRSGVRTTVLVQAVRNSLPLPPMRLTIPENIGSEQATLGLTLSPYLGIPEASVQAFSQMGTALSLVPRTFAGIFSRSSRGQDIGVAGPIRIAQAVAEGTPSGGMPFIIYLFGALSLNLAVVNALPFPGLDGGRLAFVIAEVLLGGRKLNPRIEGVAHLVGIMLLLAFTIFVSYNDVIRLLAGKSAFAP
jgi:regulator of sigma E protease